MARQLNNTMRRELALQLGAKAVKKNVPALNRLANHLTELQRKVYLHRLLEIEPDIAPGRWAGLIQKGLLTGFGGRDELQVRSVEEKDDGNLRVTFPSLRVTVRSHSRGVEGERTRERWCDFIRQLRAGEFSHALSLVYEYSLTRTNSADLLATVLAQPDLPGIPEAARFDPVLPLEQKLVKDTQAYLTRLAKVLNAGFTYAEECLDLLMACKTEKQLLDLFPEAAKLLPPPVVVTRAVVPAEQAQKLRKVLETGVPED